MSKDKYLRISYGCIDDSMKRIVWLPLGVVFRLAGRENDYDIALLKGAQEIVRFGPDSRIVKDEYGQHWYHRETKVGAMEAFDTYEPIPVDVVSEEYEAKRIPGMMIYPCIRVDHARGQMEIYENYRYDRRDEEYREEFYSLNKKFHV
jgi:hypothetical protein